MFVIQKEHQLQMIYCNGGSSMLPCQVAQLPPAKFSSKDFLHNDRAVLWLPKKKIDRIESLPLEVYRCASETGKLARAKSTQGIAVATCRKRDFNIKIFGSRHQ